LPDARLTPEHQDSTLLGAHVYEQAIQYFALAATTDEADAGIIVEHARTASRGTSHTTKAPLRATRRGAAPGPRHRLGEPQPGRRGRGAGARRGKPPIAVRP